jgi:galactokinase
LSDMNNDNSENIKESTQPDASELSAVFVAAPDAEAQWLRFETLVQLENSDFFDGDGPIAGARAPGRLDVMGGVADYSGSVVLEMPIAQACCAAIQWRNDRLLRIRSLGVEADGLTSDVTFSLDAMLLEDGTLRAPDDVRTRLTRDPQTRWASYVIGCFYVMLSAYGKAPKTVRNDGRLGEFGANVLIHSEVPLGAGVSSSAALEVAVMHALSEAAGIHPSDLTLAAWCQRVENTIVGAPCGIMDQVTAALGREKALIVLRCQPHEMLGNVSVPPGWRFVGIDSRVKHSVGGSHYTRARVGAFMGLKVIQLESGGKLLENYLCKMKSNEFAGYRELIPETITGAEYHQLYGRLPDAVTRVDPNETYHPRACAEHPILENERATSFVALMHLASLRAEEILEPPPGVPETGGTMQTVEELTSPAPAQRDEQVLREAGQMMYASHASYGDRLNLGSPETDLLVSLIREQGEAQGLYGARITGGGAGGTVAVLCAADSPDTDAALLEVCREYQTRTGITPRAFVGSSPGAIMFGARPIMRG